MTPMLFMRICILIIGSSGRKDQIEGSKDPELDPLKKDLDPDLDPLTKSGSGSFQNGSESGLKIGSI